MMINEILILFLLGFQKLNTDGPVPKLVENKLQKKKTSNFLLMDICSVRNFNRLDYDSCDFKQNFKPIRTIDLLNIITRLYWL
jgi:hypothetical protein